MKSSNVLIVLAMTAIAGVALAAGKPSKAQRAQVLQAIVDCRPLTDTDARLKCYDAAAARLDEAEAAGQVVVVDRAKAREVRKEVFGLALPSLDIFNVSGGKDAADAVKGEDVDRLTSTVKSAVRQGDGRWVFELETGAVWRQLEPGELMKSPRQGSPVEIRKASLGSFMMKVDNQPSFKVHRDR